MVVTRSGKRELPVDDEATSDPGSSADEESDEGAFDRREVRRGGQASKPRKRRAIRKVTVSKARARLLAAAKVANTQAGESSSRRGGIKTHAKRSPANKLPKQQGIKTPAKKSPANKLPKQQDCIHGFS